MHTHVRASLTANCELATLRRNELIKSLETVQVGSENDMHMLKPAFTSLEISTQQHGLIKPTLTAFEVQSHLDHTTIGEFAPAEI